MNRLVEMFLSKNGNFNKVLDEKLEMIEKQIDESYNKLEENICEIQEVLEKEVENISSKISKIDENYNVMETKIHEIKEVFENGVEKVNDIGEKIFDQTKEFLDEDIILNREKVSEKDGNLCIISEIENQKQIKQTNKKEIEVGNLSIRKVSYKAVGGDEWYIEEGYLRDEIHLIDGFGGSVTIVLSDDSSFKISLLKLKNIVNDGVTQEDLEKNPDLRKLETVFEGDIDNIKPLPYGFLKLENYEDITDYEFNNFSSIHKESLVSSGLWINNGIRKIRLDFNEVVEDFLNKEDAKIGIVLNLDKKDNDKLEHPVEFKGNINKKGEAFINFDTDELGKYFEEENKFHSFYGKLIVYVQEGQDEDLLTSAFYLPFEIKMVNPIENTAFTEEIAIDFGTSSTCIAYNEGKELIAFTDSPESLDDYENMTAMIIFNWKSIYKNWDKNYQTIPFFKRKKTSYIVDDLIEKSTLIRDNHFDYGDTIKNELSEAPDVKMLNAVITNLKSLPEKFENDKDYNQEYIIPFDSNSYKKNLFLVDNEEVEDDEHLNPIALYGFLIGKALNKQVNNKIYTRYNLTMPVNFGSYKRERIKDSIEYGLRRALPHNIKDKLEIKSDYEESVALLGAAKKLKKLKISKDKEATLFAIFDFGGGTLDFAFGLYRKATDDTELQIFEDEDNEYRDVIEIFKTDGRLVGGETLIEALSWKIYQDNKEEMRIDNIPIFVPNKEKKMSEYPDKLMSNNHIAKINLKSFNEKLSRNFFIHGNYSVDKLELFDLENKSDEYILKNLNEESANEFLSDRIEELVKHFKKVLEDTFRDNIDRIRKFGFNEFSVIDVKILQAGNACKARWVKEAFDEYFPEDSITISLIEDETKKITPKNAVAKGVLMLNNTGVYNHSVRKDGDVILLPLDRYIWDIEDIEDDGEDAEPIFKKGDAGDLDYRIIGLRRGNNFKIYHSSVSSLEDEDDENLEVYTITIPDEYLEDGKNSVCVRPYDGSKIEVVFANKYMDNIDESKKMIIDLKDGGITK